MQGGADQADSKWVSSDRNTNSKGELVRELEVMAKRFEGTTSLLRPTQIVARPQATVKTHAKVTPDETVQELNKDGSSTPAISATRFTSATCQTHLDQPHIIRRGFPYSLPQAAETASKVAQCGDNVLNRNDAASTDSTHLLQPASKAPEVFSIPSREDLRKFKHCYSAALLNKASEGSHHTHGASGLSTIPSMRLPEEGDSAEVDNYLATFGRRSTALPENVIASECNRIPQTRSLACFKMEETGASPIAHPAAPFDNPSTGTTQNTTTSARKSELHLLDSTSSEIDMNHPSADPESARVSCHTSLPHLPIASWTDNRVSNTIQNQNISISYKPGKSANTPIPISAPPDSSAQSFAVLIKTIQYFVDAYSVMLSLVIRYNWRLVPIIIMALSFLLTWVGDITYTEIVKHVIKSFMCRTSIFKSWDFCASILSSTPTLEEDVDHCKAARHALSLVHDLAITSELSTVARHLEQAHHKLYMFSVEAYDPDLITLSRNYIQNSDVLRDELQEFLTNVTVAIQWIEYLTSELANDLTYTLSHLKSETWLVYVWRWISFSERSTVVNVTELHILRTNYLVALIETTDEQIHAHIQISSAFKAIHNVIHPLTAKTNKAHLRIASAVEQRKSFWQLQWLRSSQSSNELGEKAENIELLRTYLDQAAPRLGDARQGLEGTKGTLKALYTRAVQAQQKVSVGWYPSEDKVWSDVRYVLRMSSSIEAMKNKVAKKET